MVHQRRARGLLVTRRHGVFKIGNHGIRARGIGL